MKAKILFLSAALAFSLTALAQQDTLYIMRNGAVSQKAAISDIDSIVFYNPIPPDPSTVDEGVIIGGRKWATRNVAERGHFADNPEDYGMYYQWNRTTAWATDGDVGNWDTVGAEGDEWETDNNVCPTGWRIPTDYELQSLLDAGTNPGTVNGVNGMIFGSHDNTIFLPAAGDRESGNGFYGRGSHGFYWSSTRWDSNNSYYLYYVHSSGGRSMNYCGGSYGFTIRCVAD